MTKMRNFLVLPLAVMTTFSVPAAAEDQQCATNVTTLITKKAYRPLNAALPDATVKSLTQLLRDVSDQPSYDALLAQATSLAATIGSTGRVVITLPDGTVVVDTKKPDKNTFDNFVAKTINENHNSRIAILDAQLWPCGVGVETKFSTTDKTTEVYVAKRLGKYLNSSGTVRISK